MSGRDQNLELAKAAPRPRSAEEIEDLRRTFESTWGSWFEIALVVADRNLDLAAACGGTMTAEDVGHALALVERGSANGVTSFILGQHIAAQGATVATLQSEAEKMVVLGATLISQRDSALKQVSTLQAKVGELEIRLREYHGEADGDDISHDDKNDGVAGIVAWVKENKRRLSETREGIFDTGFRCVSEGGETFYLDPEELEALQDECDALRAKHTQLEERKEIDTAHIETPIVERDELRATVAMLQVKVTNLEGENADLRSANARHAQHVVAFQAENERMKAILGTFDKRCADALADEVAVLVQRRIIDARSPAADALLDYRDPPRTPRTDRLSTLQTKVEELDGLLATEEAERIRCRDGWAQAEKDSRKHFDQACTNLAEGDAARAEVEKLKAQVASLREDIIRQYDELTERAATSRQWWVDQRDGWAERCQAAESRLAAIMERGAQVIAGMRFASGVQVVDATRWVLEGDAPSSPGFPDGSAGAPQEAKLTAYDFAAMSNTPHYPCSPTCTHDDAATPGHPERVKERSEARAAMHPNGSCKCGGEGACDWCRQSATTPDPHQSWMREHPEEVAKHQGKHIAIHQTRGIVASANTYSELTDALKAQQIPDDQAVIEFVRPKTTPSEPPSARTEKYRRLYKKWKRRAQESALDFYEGFLIGHKIGGALRTTSPKPATQNPEALNTIRSFLTGDTPCTCADTVDGDSACPYCNLREEALKALEQLSESEFSQGYTQGLKDSVAAITNLHACDTCQGVQPQDCPNFP